ncbi:MAG TPA: hypothetical protein VL362_00695 [Patescibacteria group bacterium]|jgi:hypothetical protein|nr:hypothetical protein [Patescibacteria group bacterium]
MIQINLIPDVKREYLRARRLRDIAISVAIVVSIAGVAVVIVMALILSSQAAREYFADQNIKTEYAKLSEVKDLSDMVTIQNQLSLISGQHQNKTMDSRLFSVLQAINPAPPNDVQFTSVILDPETGTLTFEGLTNGGYTAVESLTKTIQNTKINSTDGSKGAEVNSEPFATDVSVGETSYGITSDNQRVLRFDMVVTYLPSLFTNEIRQVNIVAPSRKIDVTDSKLRVPSSLFSAPAADEGGQ